MIITLNHEVGKVRSYVKKKKIENISENST